MIATIQHVDTFWAIHEDFKRVGRRFVGQSKRATLFADALHVLELIRKAQVKRLLASGLSEDQISEGQLGFALTWEQCVRWSKGHHSKRSFESIFASVVDSGVARRFYVECHRKRVGGHEEIEVVHGADGQPVLYATIEEARANRREGGDVVNYVFFNCQAVNALIREIYGIASSESQEQPDAKPRDARKVSAPAEAPASQPVQSCEGTPVQKPPKSPAKTTRVTQPAQSCEPGDRKVAREGSQLCEGNPSKVASNKNNKEKEESLLKELIIISATRAIALSQFDFSQRTTHETIKQLAQLMYAPLPARYRTEADKEAAHARIDAAALALATMPQVAGLGLRTLAAIMAYQADETSPCGWRDYCRKSYNNPGFVPRLWHLESELVLHKTIQEFSDSGWWPVYLPRMTGLVETPAAIDLAELAGVAPSERIGMALETAQDFAAWLADLLVPHGYEVQWSRVGPSDERGYSVEIYFAHEDGSRRALRLYHFDQWEVVLQAEAEAPIGSSGFVQCLAEAVQRAAGQVA
ncbi:MAG: hypothetical protein ACRDHZ_01300 [Ktedonobacteraceae bacterium]